MRPQGAVDCAWDLYGQAGITDPREQIDMAELYVPFSWYEPIWLEGHDIAELGEGWKMVDSGETEIGGSFPVNCSGGVLSQQPDRRVGAAALRRGRAAGAGHGRRAPGRGANVALGQAYGANMQYFAMWIVANSLDPFG